MREPPSTPLTLDYDRPNVGARVSQERFGCAASLLLLVNTLVGVAMALAVFFADRLGFAVWLMAGAGALAAFTVLGRLSTDRPRFGQALALSLLASGAAAAALAINLAATSRLEARIVGNRVVPVVVYLESDRGALLATLRLAWQVCAASVAATSLLALYAGWRLTRVRHARRGASLADGE